MLWFPAVDSKELVFVIPMAPENRERDSEKLFHMH